MKVIIEKQDWQLLGQIATEYIHGEGTEELASIVFMEFYAENLEAFTYPQRRKRKLKPSQFRAICSILTQDQKFRNDPIWDVTLIELREKFGKQTLQISG
jgi:hypothetical protein